MFWQPYILEGYDHTRFSVGDVVLDLGCGDGSQLHQLIENGCQAFGLDPLLDALKSGRQKKLMVLQGQAEALPFKDASFDGILCKGVLPYTDENLSLREISRVLRGGGEVDLACLGSGYYARYVVKGKTIKARIYGLRTLVNTWLCVITGRRLPGFLGDTVYQSRPRLRRAFSEVGLEIIHDHASPQFLRLPVFIYQRLRRHKGRFQRTKIAVIREFSQRRKAIDVLE